MKKIIILITILLMFLLYFTISFGHDKDIPIYYSTQQDAAEGTVVFAEDSTDK